MLKTKADIAFEVLACLSYREPADVNTIAADVGLDSDGLYIAISSILSMGVCLLYGKDANGNLATLRIRLESWHRAKLMAEAYLERTYNE